MNYFDRLGVNRNGIVDGLKKAGTVALWVAASGAVTALIAELAKYNVGEQEVWIGLAIMAANAILAGAQKWLSINASKK